MKTQVKRFLLLYISFATVIRIGAPRLVARSTGIGFAVNLVRAAPIANPDCAEKLAAV
jgi:hypothetical protein